MGYHLSSENDGDDVALMRVWLIVAGLFLASLVCSCNELRYTASGKTVQARVERLETVEVHSRYGTNTKLHVQYTFEDGPLGMRRETDEVNVDWGGPGFGQSGTVEVQYLPGVELRSRLVGHDYVFMVYVFAFFSLALVVMSIIFWRGYADHKRREAAMVARHR